MIPKKKRKLAWSTTRVGQFDSSYFRGIFLGRFHDISVPNGRVAILFVYIEGTVNDYSEFVLFCKFVTDFKPQKGKLTIIGFKLHNQCIVLCIFSVDFPLFVCLIPPPGKLIFHRYA